MSKLLLDDMPIMVLPELAVAIGYNEATTIQQLHWVRQIPKMGKVVDGRKWIRMTCEDWRIGHFPFWSDATIQRNFENLEWMGLVLTRDDLNQLGFDRTKWYAINDEALAAVENTFVESERIIEHRNMIAGHSKMRNAAPQSEGTIPESSSESQAEEKQPAVVNGEIPTPQPTPIPNAYAVWQSIGLSLSPYIAERLDELRKEHSEMWVIGAIKTAARANVRNLKYIEGILLAWAKQGYMDGPAEPKAPAITEMPAYQKNAIWQQ